MEEKAYLSDLTGQGTACPTIQKIIIGDYMFYSTNKGVPPVSLQEAVLKGMPDDNGLFMPDHIPELKMDFLENMGNLSFQEISFEVAKNILGEELPLSIIKEIIHRAINFDAPVIKIKDNISVLELFHGPTLAFKDFGARFMAGLMGYYVKNREKDLYILVATSGDTGSAVANGFLDVPGIKVIILYPSGKVSLIQEKQLTTMGSNILTLEIDGNFDDCQKLVKEAFLDKELNQELTLSSANSINIARLIPQTFYYFYAYSRIKNNIPVIFSVPSGNFGNLTAGLMAKKMGLPVFKFIASTNINDIVPDYLKTGKFHPKPSKQTISNAMDVGNPSNFVRMLDLYENNADKMRKDITGYSFTDEETKLTIKKIYESTGYVLDPHGAVACRGLEEYRDIKDFNGIFVETAHPAKFLDIVQPIINKNIDIPERLKKVLNKEKKSIYLPKNFAQLKHYLLDIAKNL